MEESLDPNGIASDEEIKRVEFSIMESLLDEKCSNGAIRLNRILNRLAQSERENDYRNNGQGGFSGGL